MKVDIEHEECYPYFKLTETPAENIQWSEGHEMSQALFDEYNKIRKRHEELTEEIKTLIDYP